MNTDQTNLILSLCLFRSLTKVGCKWHGDIVSSTWAEELFFEENLTNDVLDVLESVPSDFYKLFAGRILIK